MKAIKLSIVVLSLSLCCWAQIPSFFAPFGPTNGDTSLPANDDGSTGAIPFVFTYFGVTHTSLYVNNNGIVTFNAPVSTFTPFGLITLTAPTIAPYWADVDTRIGNTVQYRSSTDPTLLSHWSQFIQTNLGATAFCATRAFITTWPEVGYFFEHVDKLDSFQSILLSDNTGNSFVVFNYGTLQWTTGDASGGVNGLGGTPAFAGFTDGTGSVANTEQIPGSGTAAILSLQTTSNIGLPGQWAFQVNNGVNLFPGRSVHVCGVIVPGYCSGSAVCPFPSDPTLMVNSSTYTLDSTNLFSFNNFIANTGEVGGRVILKNSMALGNGFSIGSEVRTGGVTPPFTHDPFSLIIGRTGTWGSGELFPSGAGYPGQIGLEEDIFGGTSFTGPTNLMNRVRGSCTVAGCLDAQLNNIQSFYTSISNYIAGITPNVVVGSLWSGITMTCASNTALSYYVQIPDTLLAANTYFNTPTNCNMNAQWVITITGTGNPIFHGNPSFGNMATKTLWNIPGSGRTVTVETEVDGSILSPNNALFQAAGTINGQVIVSSVTSTDAMEINQIACPSVNIPPFTCS